VSWSTISDGDIGLRGSCACNCVVKSVMKVFGSASESDPVAEELADDEDCALVAAFARNGDEASFVIGLVEITLILLLCGNQARTLSLPLESKKMLASDRSAVAAVPTDEVDGLDVQFVLCCC
jgi:hypothetical protein